MSSIVATLVDYGLFWGLVVFQGGVFEEFWGNMLSASVGMLINFVLQKRFVFELKRNVSCEMAGNHLPDCEMILGQWKNITNCVAVDKNKSCGNGTVVLKRACTNGTKDLCTNFQNEKIISCDEADISLPACKGNLNGMIRIQKQLSMFYLSFIATFNPL